MEYLDILNFLTIFAVIIFSWTVGWFRLKKKNITCVLYMFYFAFMGVARLIRELFALNYQASDWEVFTRMLFTTDFSTEIEIAANVLNLMVLVAFFLGESVFWKSEGVRLKGVSVELKKSIIPALAVITLVMAALGFFVLMWAKGVPIRLDAILSSSTRMDLRIPRSWAAGVLGAQMLLLTMITVYTSLITRKWWITISGLLIAVLMLSSSGTRSYGFFFVGPVVYYLVKTKDITKRHILAVLIVLLVVAPASEILRNWRYSVTRDFASIVAIATDEESYRNLFTYPFSEFNIYSFFLESAVALYPSHTGWLYGNTYKTMLMFWLPSGLAGGEKIDTIYLFADAVQGVEGSHDTRASMHPTLTGDSYMNFGYFAFLPAFMWGAIFSWVHRMAKKSIFVDVIAGAVSVSFLIFLFRGSIFMGFFQIMTLTFFMLIFAFLCSIRYLWGDRPFRFAGLSHKVKFKYS